MSHKSKNKDKLQDQSARNETRVPPPNPAEDIALEGQSLEALDVQEGQERMQGETRPAAEKKPIAKSGESRPGKDAGIPQSAENLSPKDEL